MKNETQDKRDEVVTTPDAMAAWLQTRTILRLSLLIFLIAALLWVTNKLLGILLLLTLAVFFSYLLAPLIALLQHPWRGHRLPRTLAIGLVYLLALGSLVAFLYFLLPRIGNQLVALSQQAPIYLAQVRERTQGLLQWYEKSQLPQGLRETINQTATRTVAATGGYVSAALAQAIGWLTYLPWLLLIPILAFFLLKDTDSFRRAALQILPRGALRWQGHKFFADVNRALAVYVRGQLTACLVIGVVCMIGFELLGLPSALVLGMLAGLLEFIPLVGPFIIFVAAVVIAGFGSLHTGIEVAVFLLVLRGLEDYVIYPRLIGETIDLHPLVIILAVLCGGELGGIVGVFLAIPSVAVLSVAYRHWLEYNKSDGLVGDLLQPPQATTPPQPVRAVASISDPK